MYSSFGGGAIPVILIVTGIIGLIAGVVALFLFLPKKKKYSYSGILKYLYDFLNFDKFWFVSVFKVLFISLTFMCLIGGFICLFIHFLTGLGIIFAGVIFRLLSEVTMIIMNIGNNVSQINDKLEATSNEATTLK
jgi:hypothetical protein